MTAFELKWFVAMAWTAVTAFVLWHLDRKGSVEDGKFVRSSFVSAAVYIWGLAIFEIVRWIA